MEKTPMLYFAARWRTYILDRAQHVLSATAITTAAELTSVRELIVSTAADDVVKSEQ
jgi:hypothetical protein